jgi:hypothetical protein
MNLGQQPIEVLLCPAPASERAAGLIGLGRMCQSAQGMCGSAPTTAVDPVFNGARQINGESHVHRWRHSWNHSAPSSYCLRCAQGVSHRARTTTPVTDGVVHGRDGMDRQRREGSRVDAGPVYRATCAGERLTFPQERAGLSAIEPCRLNFEVCLTRIPAPPAADRRTAV